MEKERETVYPYSQEMFDLIDAVFEEEAVVFEPISSMYELNIEGVQVHLIKQDSLKRYHWHIPGTEWHHYTSMERKVVETMLWSIKNMLKKGRGNA